MHTGTDGLPTVSLYGRVQQEVLGSTLAEEYGIEVAFADASVLHVERPRGVGTAVERLNTDSNPYQATIGLRVLPGAPGPGIRFVTDAPAQDMPLYLFRSVEAFAGAIERHVRRGLARGRYGWRVTDCVVTLTECAYSTGRRTAVQARTPAPRTTTAGDTGRGQPGTRACGTVVCEPVLRVTLEVRPRTPPAAAAAGPLGCRGDVARPAPAS